MMPLCTCILFQAQRLSFIFETQKAMQLKCWHTGKDIVKVMWIKQLNQIPLIRDTITLYDEQI